MPAEVESMFYVEAGGVPWHKLGTPIKDAPNSEIALHESGLDWQVTSSPLYTEVGDEIVQVEGFVSNVRSSDGSILGVVSNRYTIVQNRDAFKFTDELVGSGDVRYETAGSLRGGKVVWMLAQMEDTKVLGDEVNNFMLFSNSHDGGSCVRVCMTPIRVVCANTLNLALDGASRTWQFRHIGNIDARVQEARDTLFRAREYVAKLADVAEELAAIRISDDAWWAMTQKLLPIKDTASQRIEEAIRAERDDLYQTMFMKPDLQVIKNTGWGVVNAVADFADHRTPKRYSPTANESRFELITGGHPLVDAAYELVKAA